MIAGTDRITVIVGWCAARQVDTELICFLEVGVQITPCSLDVLVSFLDTRPDVAAVAPVTVGPDGHVWEAGGVIGGDGRCLPYRAGEATLFSREVDYAGTSCLVLRSAAYHDVADLATTHDNAEFHAAELGMALRESGWRIWVVPAAKAVVCSGDPAGPADEVSRVAFRTRWADRLAGRVPVTGVNEHPHHLWWLRDRLAPFRVLLVDDRVPQPDRGRGDPRTMAVLNAWRDADPNARVTFFAASPDRADECAPALLDQGIEVVWGVVDARRWSVERFGLYDVIVLFRPHNLVQLGDPIASAQPQAVRVYESEALFHRRAQQYQEHAETDLLREWEVRAFNWADIAVCVSDDEAEWARIVAPTTSTHVVSYRATVPDEVPGWLDRDGVVFFGGFDSAPGTPNERAVLELAEQVLPDLRRRCPGLSLRIIGADPSPAVLNLAGEHIAVLGQVADPRPLLGSALLHVVPMRYGAGVKIKFIESMAAGLPFVTTSVGAEGLHLGATTRHLVGESPAEIVDLCHRLLTDRVLWTDVQQSLVDICRQHFSAERFAMSMLGVLADCGVAPVRLPLGGRQPTAEQHVVDASLEHLGGEVLLHNIK